MAFQIAIVHDAPRGFVAAAEPAVGEVCVEARLGGGDVQPVVELRIELAAGAGVVGEDACLAAGLGRQHGAVALDQGKTDALVGWDLDVERGDADAAPGVAVRGLVWRDDQFRRLGPRRRGGERVGGEESGDDESLNGKLHLFFFFFSVKNAIRSWWARGLGSRRIRSGSGWVWKIDEWVRIDSFYDNGLLPLVSVSKLMANNCNDAGLNLERLMSSDDSHCAMKRGNLKPPFSIKMKMPLRSEAFACFCSCGETIPVGPQRHVRAVRELRDGDRPGL